MKLSPEQLRQNAAAMLALADGKPVEYQNSYGLWLNTEDVNSGWPHRPKPWTLPAPPAGKQWHRTDWTEEMLSGSFRPLLLGERAEAGDTCFPEMTRRWEPVMGILGLSVDGEFCPVRTLRPLPVEPVVRPWSGGMDVPLACWIRLADTPTVHHWVSCVWENGLAFHDSQKVVRVNWDRIARYEHSTDRKTWHPCTVTDQP